jgi:hypothetical protein
LAADPLNPRVVYAGSNQQGLLRSTDGGATWLPAGLAGIAIRSVAVSPSRSGILCVGTKPPGLFISHDHGATWQDLAGLRKRRQWWWFTPAEPGAAYTQAVALSPTDPNVILAGIELGAVLRSEDCGVTAIRSRSMSTMGVGPMKAEAPAQAQQSAGTVVKLGCSPVRDLTVIMGGRWQRIRPAPKYGMRQSRPVHSRRMEVATLRLAFFDPKAAQSGKKSQGRSLRCPMR